MPSTSFFGREEEDSYANYYPRTSADTPSQCSRARTRFDSSIGIANACFAAGMLFSSIWLSLISARFGHRIAYLFGLLGNFLGFVLWALVTQQYSAPVICSWFFLVLSIFFVVQAPTFPILLAARFFAGLFGGSQAIGKAFILDHYELDHERDDLFWQLQGTLMIIGLVGPIAGGGLVKFFDLLWAPLYFAACFSFASFVSVWISFLNQKCLFSAGSKEENDDFLEEVVTVDSNIGTEDIKFLSQSSTWGNRLNVARGLVHFFIGVALNSFTILAALLLLDARYKVVDLDESVTNQGKDLSLQVFNKGFFFFFN